MASIDERVVSLKFDNKQFEQGIKQSQQSLDGFSTSETKLTGLRAGLEKIKGLFSGFRMTGLEDGIETATTGFNMLENAASVAFGIIASKAIAAGAQMANSFAFKPIFEGFGEYETKIGSIQTILANTARHGTTLEDINAALSDLNDYADKTIYNFGDMTRNIGLFTNAGLGVEESTSMIKGFSNEAARSGTSAAAAAGAAYQLSQALATGTIRLMDWKSIQNANMGGANMREGLLRVAEAMGTVSASGTTAEAIQNDFNGSLEKGWLSADVMSSYLRIMAGDMDEAQMAAMGLSEEQIKMFQEEQKMAEEAATKVRTLTQLLGTIGEAIGSGWAQTFEILFGDFEEATELFTGINNAVTPIIDGMTEARNNLLQGWSDAGGRAKVIEALSNAFKGLWAVMGSIGDAWSRVFPPMTVDTLTNITNKISDFSAKLVPSAATTEKLTRVFAGLFAVVKIGVSFLSALGSAVFKAFGGIGGAAGSVLDLAAAIGDWLVGLEESISSSNIFTDVLGGIANVANQVLTFLWSLGSAAKTAGSSLLEALDLKSIFSGLSFDGALDWIADAFSKLGDLDFGSMDLSGFADTISSIASAFGSAGGTIGSFLASVGSGIQTFLNGGGLKAIFAGVSAAGIFSLGVSIAGFVKTLSEYFDKGDDEPGGVIGLLKKFFGKGGIADDIVNNQGSIKDAVKDTFGSLTDTLGEMQNSLKAATLISIATAVGILTWSCMQLSTLDAGQLGKSVAAIGAMMVELSIALKLITKSLDAGTTKGIIKAGVALILFAAAVRILAGAVTSLGQNDTDNLIRGMTATVILLAAVTVVAKNLDKTAGSTARAGVSIILFAAAVKILASAVADLGAQDTDTLIKGLVSVGVLLGAITAMTKIVSGSKGMISTGVGILIVSAALKILSGVITEMGGLSWTEIGKGLAVVAGALVAISAALKLVPATAIFGAAGILIAAAALKILGDVMKDLSTMSWEEIAKGLVSLAGALLIVVVATNAMSGALLGAAAMIVVAAAIKILVPPLKSLGDMSWGEIAKAMVALAGGLLILAVGVTLMSAAIVGALVLPIVAASLLLLVPALKALGNMSWGEIAKGLIALAAALLVIAVGGAALTGAVPGLLGLGAAILLIGAGVFLAATGLALLAGSLAVLISLGTAATEMLQDIVLAFIETLPELAVAFGESIVALLDTFVANQESFTAAAVAFITSMLTAIQETAPQFAETIRVLLDSFIPIIQEYIPTIAQLGVDLFMAFLNAMNENIPKIVDTASSIVINFLNGISANLPGIVQAGINLIITFIDTMTVAINNNAPRLRASAKNLIVAMIDAVTGGLASKASEVWSSAREIGSNIISGIKNGITSGIQSIKDAATSAASSALNAAKSFLGIKSPSREFAKVGKWSMIGFANGITKYSGTAKKAASDSMAEVLERFKNTGGFPVENLDFSDAPDPVIRPVVDLSEVEKSRSQIDNILGEHTTGISSVSMALTPKPADFRSGNSPYTDPSRGGTTFIQNNYSPKALDPTTVYRQTRNLISVSKSGA